MPSSIPQSIQLVENINACPEVEFPQRYLSSSLEFHPTSRAFSKNSHGVDPTGPPSFTITLKSLSSIQKTELKACFDLVTETSADDYRASQKGWKPRAKWREMSEPDMRYLLVRISSTSADNELSESNPIVAFLSFMITIEDAMPVLYIYEIHISQSVRRMGLGAHLMNIAENVAENTGMRCTMLTVFRRNDGARKFYTGRGYEVSPSSPEDKVLRGGKVKKCDYLILGKWTKQKDVKATVDVQNKEEKG